MRKSNEKTSKSRREIFAFWTNLRPWDTSSYRDERTHLKNKSEKIGTSGQEVLFFWSLLCISTDVICQSNTTEGKLQLEIGHAAPKPWRIIILSERLIWRYFIIIGVCLTLGGIKVGSGNKGKVWQPNGIIEITRGYPCSRFQQGIPSGSSCFVCYKWQFLSSS